MICSIEFVDWVVKLGKGVNEYLFDIFLHDDIVVSVR